jgi:hypothetical protein
MSYGPSVPDMLRRSAVYVDKPLRRSVQSYGDRGWSDWIHRELTSGYTAKSSGLSQENGLT